MPVELKNISVAASLEKHKLSSGEQWVALVEITWPDLTQLRLCQNVDDIVFDSNDGMGPQTYQAFNWQFDALEEKSDGSIPKWAVRCSNVNLIVEGLIEQFGGGVGGEIAIFVVNTSKLQQEPETALFFDILSSGSNAQWVTFQLGAPSPFRILHPRHIYTSNRCMWVYKGPQCGYGAPVVTTGTLTSGSDAFDVASATGISVGDTVTGTGVPGGTTVATLSGTSGTLSANATADGTPTLTFTSNSLLPTCSLRIDGSNGCRAHSNQKRFGAFPGIDSNGIRIVSVR
jgi:phage-related protein